MKSRYLKVAAPLMILLLLCAAYAWLSTPAEPVWNGRPLNEWLDDLTRGPSKEVREPAEEAIHSMGAKAIPSLVRMLRAHDSVPTRVLNRINSWQKLHHFSVPSAVEERRRAWMGFQALGERGEPAIPELSRLLIEGPNPEFVAYALSSISARSVPALLDAVPCVPSKRRPELLQATMKWPSQEALIVPALRQSLAADTNEDTRALAASLLGRFSSNPAVVPALMQSLAADNNEHVRAFAAALLGRFSSNPDVIPALIAALDDPEYTVRVEVLVTLGNLGPKAAAALPAIEKLAQNPGFILPSVITNALTRVRPESP